MVQRSLGCTGGVPTDSNPLGANPRSFKQHTNHVRNEAKVRSRLRDAAQANPTGGSNRMLTNAINERNTRGSN